MYEKITQIIRDYTGEKRPINEETNLVTDLGLSSFDVVSLIGEFEDAFGIEIPTEDIEELETVGGIVDYLEEVTA